jgi:hypothetical protein
VDGTGGRLLQASAGWGRGWLRLWLALSSRHRQHACVCEELSECDGQCLVAVNPPFVPEDNPTGCYQLTFAAPAAAADHRVLLVFEGVDSAFYCWLNGQVGLAELCC